MFRAGPDIVVVGSTDHTAQEPAVEGHPGAGLDVDGEAVAGAVRKAGEDALERGGEPRERRREEPPMLLGREAPLPALMVAFLVGVLVARR